MTSAAEAKAAEAAAEAPIVQPEARKRDPRVLSEELQAVLKAKPVEALKHLQHGEKLQKVRSRGTYQRNFYLREGLESMRYRSHRLKCMQSDDTNIDIADIVDVREGCKTDVLNGYYDKEGLSAERKCFSVIHGANRDSLDLVAPSPEARDQWVKALRFLVAKYKAMEERDTQDRWLRRYFKQADRNYDGVLSFEEICKLLDKINVQMKRKDIRKIFEQSADTTLARTRDDSDALDFKAFAHFYRIIARRPEIEKIFARFSHGDVYLAPEKLLHFLEAEQKMSGIDLEECARLIRKHEPIEENKRRGNERLSIDGFVNLLRGPVGDLYNHKQEQVVQDMTRPLAEYFMASSHNTYLTEHQLKGPSSVEPYIFVLQKGCRLVELDCYDGSDNEPKVTHGFTLAGDVKLKDICDAVRDFAFKASPYPVVLSIENHCSLEQQKVMAKLFSEKFGDMLYTGPVAEDMTDLPSPEELKHKILIKNKKLPRGDSSLNISDDEEEADKDQDLEELEREEMRRSEGRVEKRTRQRKAFAKGSKKLAPELSEHVRLTVSKHFQGLDVALKQYHSGCLSSLKEAKCDEVANSEPSKFVRYTNKFMTKVYPGANRMWDSSNLRPYHYWPLGVQIVAMNYQYMGENMQLNDALFARNGSCGYVLKPDFMRSGDGAFNPKGPFPSSWKRLIRVTVISGQNLPKPPGDDKDIVDPFVKVKMYGVEQDRQMGKTATIKNNGLNPEWSQQFMFHAHVPELALLRFVVKDEDKYTNADFIGQYTLHVASLQEGFRHVHLLDKRGESIAPASLFIHVKIVDPN